MFYIDGRDCVLCQFVESFTFALCALYLHCYICTVIFALRNIALVGYFFGDHWRNWPTCNFAVQTYCILTSEKTAEHACRGLIILDFQFHSSSLRR